ncbi:MAG: ring-opening amidohydrolase [Alphaproteobacteria bacterium]
MPEARVHRIAAGAPDDFSGLEALIASGRLDPARIVAVFGKTAGNGLVNDFSRGLATTALRQALLRHVPPERAAAVAAVMSGGTEGGMAPHWLVFERVETDDAGGPALAIGVAHTAPLPAEHLGRAEQVAMVRDGVLAAMENAGITRSEDVHFAQVKCPLLTAERIATAEARGASAAIRDTLKSMGLSRGAASLGVAAALGEVPIEAATQERIGADPSLYSGVASASAGIELQNHEIVVLGMSPAWSGPLAIDHAVMADGLDVEPVRAALRRLGLAAEGQLAPGERERLVALLAKAEASRSGRLRGRRHTMNDDSDVSSTRHARAFVAGSLGGLVGHGEIYVSGGAEHQGPDGGGPVAAIVRR